MRQEERGWNHKFLELLEFNNNSIIKNTSELNNTLHQIIRKYFFSNNGEVFSEIKKLKILTLFTSSWHCQGQADPIAQELWNINTAQNDS